MEILEGLNPEQRRAAEATRGPVCILAGAGSGKTTTITRRIAWQVASGAVRSDQILAVTFTDKAAGEMRARLARLGVEGVEARTFHSAALAQLRRARGEGSGRILSTKALLLRQIGNEDPMQFSRRTRGRIAYMPQLFSLYEDLSAQENVGFVAALYGIGPFKRRSLIRRALEVVDLWEARHRLARDLSGGMQRRLELACALVHSPDVLFVDEPTAGIDPLLRQSIWDELRELRDQGRTLLVTTQYVTEAEYCDRVALIVDGELVALDEPGALRQMVFGGDVLQVDTARAVDPDMLSTVPGVQRVQQTAPRQLFVTVDDAATMTTDIIDTLRGQGIEVAGIEEHQPTFDEVFTGLVEQRRAARGMTEDPTPPRGASDA